MEAAGWTLMHPPYYSFPVDGAYGNVAKYKRKGWNPRESLKEQLVSSRISWEGERH